jgi:hypothetical protein
MSNYTKATDFLSKDGLLPGNPLKVVRGSEIDAEFEAIQTAVATKADSATTYTETEIDGFLSTLSMVTGYVAGTAPGKLVTVSAGFTLSTGLAAGTIFNVYNNSASSITITQDTGLTLRLVGSSLTGNRTIGAYGLATIIATSTTVYLMNGAGVS